MVRFFFIIYLAEFFRGNHYVPVSHYNKKYQQITMIEYVFEINNLSLNL